MASPYKLWPGLESHPLGAISLSLRAAYNKPCRLSPLVAMSDPTRTPDILSWAKTLPGHCALIYRYTEFDGKIAKELRRLTQSKKQQLLFRQTNISDLSDGLHFRRHTPLEDIESLRHTRPDALLTLAAPKPENYETRPPRLDGLFVSAIFPSKSPSAGEPIGVKALKDKVQHYSQFETPIYALGGININTAPSLLGTSVAGIAAIGGLKV